MPDDGANRNLADLWQAAENPQLWGRFARQAACLASAGGGCAAVTECLGYRIARPEAGCTPGCQGSEYTQCSDVVAISLRCSALGLACHDEAACIDGTPTPCDRGSHVATCDGTGQPLTCNDRAVRRGPDCSALGLRCEQGACRGLGAACEGPHLRDEYRVEYSGLACDGDMLRACVGGFEHAIDCAAIAPGFSCREAEGVRFCGLGDACVPGNHPDFDQPGTGSRCEGDALALCNAGRIDRVDCRALGFERCGDASGQAGCLPDLASALSVD
jgi:hypothetical protein